MKRRVVDVLLILVVAVGAILAVRTGYERSVLRKEHDRLVAIVGELPIKDPSKVYIRAVSTGEPLHFAWRVYLPPKYTLLVREGMGGSSSSWHSDSHEFTARVRFREDDSGTLMVYTKFSGTSSNMHLGDQKLTQLLRGRWDQIQVEQLGEKELVVVNPDQGGRLLKLVLPPEIQEEVRKTFNEETQKRYIPELFKVEFGPP